MYNGPNSTTQIAKESVHCADTSPIADFDPNIAANISPLPSAGIPPFQVLPTSSFDDLLFSTNSIYDSSLSSPYFIDWQSNSSYLYDGKFNATFIAPDFACESDYLNIYQSDDYMDVLPDLSNSTTLFQTPIMTPKADISPANNRGLNSPLNEHHNHAHLDKGAEIDDLHSFIAARDGWSVFRSSPTPRQTLCPQTPKLYLENLENSWREFEHRNTWQLNVNEVEMAINGGPDIIPFQEDSRNKLSETTQIFLHKALEIHREDGTGTPRTRASNNSPDFSCVLPPVHILEQFLRAYATSFERHFPLVFRARLDANELLTCCDEKASSLLILMMLAQGATTFHSVENHSFIGGLTEVCRISLYDLVEKNIALSVNSTVLQSALLVINQAAWSGDKWQMDIAMRQRGMYMAILKHPGFQFPNSNRIECNSLSSQNEVWLNWSEMEMGSRYFSEDFTAKCSSNSCMSRLFHCWAMLDQELSLFHDTSPSFTIADFVSPMPDSNYLWYAKTATDWALVYQQIHEPAEPFTQIQSIRRPFTLRNIFRQLLDVDSNIENLNLTALQLRLLLYPLQTIVFQSQLFASYLIGVSSSSSLLQSMQGSYEATSTSNQLTEIQAWLGRWHTLVKKYLTTNAVCPVIQASLVLFQMISLNTMVDFPAIEADVRGDTRTEAGEEQSLSAFCHFHSQHLGGSSTFSVRQVVYHCEKILSLVRAMHRNVRPSWWPGAVYRACLILWTIQSAYDKDEGKMGVDLMMAFGAANKVAIGAATGSNGVADFSLGSLSSLSSLSSSSSSAGDVFAHSHHSFCSEQQDNDGTGDPSFPVGVLPGMQNANEVICRCVEIIEEGAPTRLAEGIVAKLKRLLDRK